jgi:hypothetical protein
MEVNNGKEPKIEAIEQAFAEKANFEKIQGTYWLKSVSFAKFIRVKSCADIDDNDFIMELVLSTRILELTRLNFILFQNAIKFGLDDSLMEQVGKLAKENLWILINITNSDNPQVFRKLVYGSDQILA